MGIRILEFQAVFLLLTSELTLQFQVMMVRNRKIVEEFVHHDYLIIIFNHSDR